MEKEISDEASRIGGVTLPVWLRLYDLADRLRSLAPWDWMGIADSFGVRLADSDETGFVAFLGQGADFRACAVFRGWDAWRDALAARLSQDEPVWMIETPQLQLAYFDRSLVSSAEAEVIRALGRRYRGRQAWPVFRCHRVGYLPWMVDQDEAHWLAGVLHQAYGMAMRVETDRSLLQSRFPEAFLVRVQDRQGAWSDDWQVLPQATNTEISVSIDLGKIGRLKAGPPQTRRLQIDLAITTAVVRAASEARPQTAYVLMVVDAETGRIEAGEILQATGGIEAMWARVPDLLLQVFLALGGCPREIEVRSERMANVVRSLSEMLPFRLTRREKLGYLEQAREGLNAYFKGRVL
jgi:hypothetical protein